MCNYINIALIIDVVVVGIGNSKVSLFVSGVDHNAHRWASDQLLTEVSPAFTASHHYTSSYYYYFTIHLKWISDV